MLCVFIPTLATVSGYPIEWSSIESHYFLRSESTIRCDGSVHDSLEAEAIILVAVWPVGSVVLFLGLVAHGRRRLLDHVSDSYVRAMNFLHKDVKPSCCECCHCIERGCMAAT